MHEEAVIAKSFSEGDVLFYPAHGVVTLKGKETHTFGEQSQDFVILEMRRGGRTMLPESGIDQVGLRSLLSARKAKRLIKSMKEVPGEIDKSESWKERAARLGELLKEGIPEDYIAVLQELLYRAAVDKISTTESKVLEQARSYFISEFNEVLSYSPDKLDRELESAFAHLKPVPEKKATEDDKKKATKKKTSKSKASSKKTED